MSSIRVRTSRLSTLVAASTAAFAANTTLPYATVTAVAATSPVVRSTPAVAISAKAVPAFDANSGPTTAQTACKPCSKGDRFCGSDNNAVKTQQVLTTTSVTVGNKSMVLRAAPEFGSANPSIADLSETSTPRVYAGTLPTPPTGVDGVQTVTVTAYLSEDVTTATTVTTNNMSASSCGGSVISSVAATPTSVTVQKSGTGTANGTYILDINAPELWLQPVTSQRRVQQGGNKVIHNLLIGGSAKMPYTISDTAIGPDGTAVNAGSGDSFGPAGKGDGIGPDKHDMVSVHIPCNCAVGEYATSPIATVANTVDLLGNVFPPVSTGTPVSFSVDPGMFLQTQTLVVSELPPVGDYAEFACFNSTAGGAAKDAKVNTSPGSLHITATVKTTGPCSGFGTMNNVKVSLSIPIGFVFADTGNSPKAHVFVGRSEPGFNLHYPVTMTEITAYIPKATTSADGQTVTIDLSTLDVPTLQGPGLLPGQLPSNYTIYVRAHVIPDLAFVPLDGTVYTYRTRVAADLPGIGNAAVESTQDVTALPVSACVNGADLRQ